MARSSDEQSPIFECRAKSLRWHNRCFCNVSSIEGPLARVRSRLWTQPVHRRCRGRQHAFFPVGIDRPTHAFVPPRVSKLLVSPSVDAFFAPCWCQVTSPLLARRGFEHDLSGACARGRRAGTTSDKSRLRRIAPCVHRFSLDRRRLSRVGSQAGTRSPSRHGVTHTRRRILLRPEGLRPGL